MRLCMRAQWAKSIGGSICENCKGIGHTKLNRPSPGGAKHVPQIIGGKSNGARTQGKSQQFAGKGPGLLPILDADGHSDVDWASWNQHGAAAHPAIAPSIPPTWYQLNAAEPLAGCTDDAATDDEPRGEQQCNEPTVLRQWHRAFGACTVSARGPRGLFANHRPRCVDHDYDHDHFPDFDDHDCTNNRP